MWTGILLLCVTSDTGMECSAYTSGLFAQNETECYQMLGNGIQYVERLGWTVESYLCHNWYPQKKGEES